MRWVLFAAFGVVGCKDSKDLDLSCTDEIGYADASQKAIEGLNAANCYRELMGLDLGVLDPHLDNASRNHAEYMARQAAISHHQIDGEPGFTGQWVRDRIVESGYDYGPGKSVSEVVAYGHSPVESVDAWINSVYHRIPFTLPSWLALGFGHVELYTSMTLVSVWPDGVRTAVIYPANGQTGVNPSFDSDSEMPDPAPDHGLVGTPITVTVADVSISGSETNPYSLRLVEAEFSRLGGEPIEALLSDPSTDDALSQMAVILPVAPLDPGEQYTAKMVVEWGGSAQTLTTVFTTGSAP